MRKMVIVMFVCLVVAVVSMNLWNALQQDVCLDNGGCWNAQTGICSMKGC